VKVIAWIFTGNARLAHTGVGNVAIADPAVRGVMVSEARWLVNECGFDGIQWDYEICDNGDPHLLALLRETRAALPTGKLLSVATPVWSPLPGRLGWSEPYFTQIAALCDQITVMGYDTGMYLPRAYVWLTRQQVVHVTQAVARGNPRCRVLIGVPTYGKGLPSHHPWSENLRMALKGVQEGLADSRTDRSVFAGVAPFADYTTQPEEWETYRTLWLAGKR
jgi:spore germination protein YaaH